MMVIIVEFFISCSLELSGDYEKFKEVSASEQKNRPKPIFCIKPSSAKEK